MPDRFPDMTDSNSHFVKEDGVYISKDTAVKFADFEKNYLSVRQKEQRVLNIDWIRKLPDVPENYIHYKEWQIRKKNISRFLKYLSKKQKKLRILDIGCGNGFFTNSMAAHHQVVGVEVNLTELKQAAEAFPDSDITWYYCDILNETLPESKFDLITFCASFQYFNDPETLLKRCEGLLNAGGEIHIIDSPFYTTETRVIAKNNSAAHFSKMDVKGMTKYYHHNTPEVLKNFKHRFAYTPNKWLRRFFTDSPFPWIIIYC